MAKIARSAPAPIESEFDFSRFIDLDDEDSQKSQEVKDSDFESLPYLKSQIITGGLEISLPSEVDRYFKAGKLPRGAKKAINRLTSENSNLESDLKVQDQSILDLAESYDKALTTVLKEKNRIKDDSLLDSTDPYDSGSASLEANSPEAQKLGDESTEMFKKLEALESTRELINKRRTEVLEEIKSNVQQYKNGGWEILVEILEERIKAIEDIQDITKTDFTEEEKVEFDKGVEDLNDYVTGKFDPLEDEDDEDYSELETPLSTEGHSVEELEAIVKASSEPESEQSIQDLFTRDLAIEEDSVQTNNDENEKSSFSKTENQSELFEALGEDSFDPNPQTSDEDIAIFEDDGGTYLTDDLNDRSKGVGSSLSEFESINDSNVSAEENTPEIDAEHDEEVQQINDFEAEGGLVLDATNTELATDIESVKSSNEPVFSLDSYKADSTLVEPALEIADIAIDDKSEVRAVIFEELKEQYGLSFDFENN